MRGLRLDWSGKPYTRQRELVAAADVVALRRRLGLTQQEFADRLGVTRRTVIRGEHRGLEVPLYQPDSRRESVADKWRELREAGIAAAAGDTLTSSSTPAIGASSAAAAIQKSDSLPAIAAKKSPRARSRPKKRRDTLRRIPHKKSPPAVKAAGASRKKRLRLSRELIKARGGKRARS